MKFNFKTSYIIAAVVILIVVTAFRKSYVFNY